MHDDDRPIAMSLPRRRALALIGGASLLSSAAVRAVGGAGGTGETGSAGETASRAPRICVVRPAQTEGPFFVDKALQRRDVRGGVAGVPLDLEFQVSRIAGTSCAPIRDAHVDLWHCDADGRYSGVDGQRSTAGADFLRGWQTTDADGSAQFATIYPGWYDGRAVHIHFKIRATDAGGRPREFTSQLYFDDALSARIFAAPAYARRAHSFMRNADDYLYRHGGRDLIAAAQPDGAGYRATFAVALKMS